MFKSNTIQFFHVSPFVMKASSEEKAAARSSQAFTEDLRGLFKQQFANQQQTLNFLLGKLEPMAQTGFEPGEETALRTSFSDQNSVGFQNALKAFQERSRILGNNEVSSGQVQANLSRLFAAQAASEAAGQNQITLQGANYKRQALGALTGIAGIQNPAALMGGAIQSGADSFKEIQAAFPNFWGTLFQNMLGNMVQGGISTALGVIGGKIGGSAGQIIGGMGGQANG